MYTPIFRNKVHDVRFVFPKLYVHNKEYAKDVGNAVNKAAIDDNFVDVEFIGEVVDLKELWGDTENLRVISPFDIETGEQGYILVLDPVGKVTEEVEKKLEEFYKKED